MNAYSREQIDIFRSIFKGRHDAYGAGDGVCIKEPLSDEVLQGHFNGIRRIGLYPLSPEILDGKGTYWIVADADDKENDRLAEAIALKEILAQRGIDSHIERSKSKGYHIWVFLSAPIEAIKAREAMRSALDALEKDTGYKIKEIFPKQEFIDPNDINNFGNYINLPMFGRDLINGRTAFLDPANDYNPCSNTWDFIKNIAKVKPDQLERPIKQDEASTDGSSKTPRKGESKYPCFKEMIKGVDKGCRNNVAFALSMQLRVGESSQKATSALLKDVWNPLNRPPLETSEIDKIIDDVYRAKNGRGYYGIGCNQIEEFCGKETCIIYKKQVSQKFAKNNRYFNNGTFIPKLLADELMEEFPFMNVAEKIHVYREGVYVPEGKHLIEFEAQRRLGDATYDYRIKEVIVYIEREKYIKPDETMDNAEVINLKNGLLNWREGTLSPHSPEYKSIIQIPVEYDPEATCPKIDNFLETTLPSDYTPLIEELLGYFLIPDTKMEKAVMLLGAGSNGKSTLTRLIGAFIGDENVAKIPLQDLSPDNRFSVAGLYGKLLNVFSDIDSKALERSSFFKAIVSGDTIKAEQKHKDHFYFTPHARLLFSCNELPRCFDSTYAYYRRWIIIPFNNKFEKDKADRLLISKITTPTELSGLLNKALEGLWRLHQNNDFSIPESVQAELRKYTRYNDSVVAFAQDACIFEYDARVSRKTLYAAYKDYCVENGLQPLSSQRCYDRLRATYRLMDIRDADGYSNFVGIRLKNNTFVAL